MNGNEQLTQLICQEITKSGGAISFAKFMELALYAPDLGYYNTEKMKFGQAGDFVTASEISPLFAACIARQCQQILSTLAQGSILEIGAGSGKFAKDLLLELNNLNCLPERYLILEISPSLRAQQLKLFQQTCPEFLPRIQWLDQLPAEPIQGIIFANEVLDALPFHCFEIANNQIEERCVSWENQHFCWQNNRAAADLAANVNAILRESELPSGYRSEINLALQQWVSNVAQALKKGLILLLDYGYGRREYYHPDRTEGTLMCFYQHQKHSDPFVHIGLQDMTAHVDFTSVAESAVTAGLDVSGYTTQAAFLLACGLMELANPTDPLSASETYQQAQAIKTLTLPAQMGEIIKVMGLTKHFDQPLLGFALHNRRKDL